MKISLCKNLLPFYIIHIIVFTHIHGMENVPLLKDNEYDTIIIIKDEQQELSTPKQWCKQTKKALSLPLARYGTNKELIASPLHDIHKALQQHYNDHQSINEDLQCRQIQDSFLYNVMQLPPQIQYAIIQKMIHLGAPNSQQSLSAINVFLQTPFLYAMQQYHSNPELIPQSRSNKVPLTLLSCAAPIGILGFVELIIQGATNFERIPATVHVGLLCATGVVIIGSCVITWTKKDAKN